VCICKNTHTNAYEKDAGKLTFCKTLSCRFFLDRIIPLKKEALFTLLSGTEGVLPIGRIQMSLKEKFFTDSSKVEVMQ